ncbi:MAG: hypothetical protein VX726_10715 [Planctomycetota bacterium]|nr:hypothetical protein [Planctomycetota bacterium]
MDDRLKQVQTTDLTDSRVNRDFVDWLKTKGMNYLLVVLLAACAYIGFDWYRRQQTAKVDTAWSELEAASSPAAYRGVATAHGETGAIAELAMLQAGDTLLQSILTGLKPGMTPGAEGAALTAEERTTYLADADEFYAEAGRLAARRDGLAGKPVGLSALFGRAAIAEAAGRIDDARAHLEAAAALAAPEFPNFVEQAGTRMENLELVIGSSDLPTQASIFVPTVEGDAFTAPVAEDLLELFEEEDYVEESAPAGSDDQPTGP